ncbi:hypothetical protein HY750_02235 [Candidatus Kuenenbacteria bacterium]|nr:hypothetical protein [Candidatus Kuenenbacteria bacterium]
MPEEKKQQENLEDIFSSIEATPKQSNIFKEMELEELPEEEEIPEVAKTSSKFFGPNKKVFIIVGGVIVVILIFFGIYTIMPKIKAIKEERELQEKNIDTQLQTKIIEQSANIDSDKDGLSDKEEIQFNTNPLKVDTDNDGLSDRDEIKTWKTDPLNPDTDGDGINDGDEIKRKLNPNGEGTLLEILKWQ